MTDAEREEIILKALSDVGLTGEVGITIIQDSIIVEASVGSMRKVFEALIDLDAREGLGMFMDPVGSREEYLKLICGEDVGDAYLPVFDIERAKKLAKEMKAKIPVEDFKEALKTATTQSYKERMRYNDNPGPNQRMAGARQGPRRNPRHRRV